MISAAEGYDQVVSSLLTPGAMDLIDRQDQVRGGSVWLYPCMSAWLYPSQVCKTAVHVWLTVLFCVFRAEKSEAALQ